MLHASLGSIQQQYLTGFLALLVLIRLGQRCARSGQDDDFGGQIGRGSSKTEKLRRGKVGVNDPYTAFGRTN
ncbi:hypothetical protein D3C78_1912140 [compost metagenome]